MENDLKNDDIKNLIDITNAVFHTQKPNFNSNINIPTSDLLGNLDIPYTFDLI